MVSIQKVILLLFKSRNGVVLNVVAEKTVSNFQSVALPKFEFLRIDEGVESCGPTSMVVFPPALDSTMHVRAVTEVLENLQFHCCKIWPPFPRVNLKLAIRRSELFQFKQ